MELNWEIIYRLIGEDCREFTSRAKAIGGWLVLHEFFDRDADRSYSNMVFIPDPIYSWGSEDVKE